MNYQFGPNDMVGGSGTFYTSRFRDVPAGSVSLLDTDTQQADGFYTHRLARSDWIGAAYEFQQLSFTPGVDQATTHSFLLFNTIYLRPRMSISIIWRAGTLGLRLAGRSPRWSRCRWCWWCRRR